MSERGSRPWPLIAATATLALAITGCGSSHDASGGSAAGSPHGPLKAGQSCSSANESIYEKHALMCMGGRLMSSSGMGSSTTN